MSTWLPALGSVWDVLMHIDTHLTACIALYGIWIYALVFGVVVVETGCVIMPFLPGDSLLFALGSLSAQPDNVLRPGVLFVVLTLAAFLGNQINYGVGHRLGLTAARRFIARDHLARTQAFYALHGKKALIIARFLPLLRTLAPFMAGVAVFPWQQFMLYNAAGAVLWVGIVLGLGYGLGSIPLVTQHFSLALYTLIGITLLPLLWSVAASWFRKRVSG